MPGTSRRTSSAGRAQCRRTCRWTCRSACSPTPPTAAVASTWNPATGWCFLTDGMVERNAVGVDFPAAIAETRALHPREAVRAMADRVLEATGNTLEDDATVLVPGLARWARTRPQQSSTEPSRSAPANPSFDSAPIGWPERRSHRW